MAAITAAPRRRPFSCWFLCLPREGCFRSVLTPLQTSLGPPPPPHHHHCRSSGERCCGVLMWPYMLFSSVYLSSKLFPPCPPPPLLSSAFFSAQELLIYVLDHDASQLAVVSPSACHWYDSPSCSSSTSSLLLNDFLLPLASLPLSSCALHDKSGQPLHPSKANDHHLFPFSPVTAASVALHTCKNACVFLKARRKTLVGIFLSVLQRFTFYCSLIELQCLFVFYLYLKKKSSY